MTNEEALKELKTVCYGMDRELERVIIEALEKQIPRKPIEDGYYDVACACPFCGYDLHDNHEFQYCPDCGQAIDWKFGK